jgi:hypothetical protein
VFHHITTGTVDLGCHGISVLVDLKDVDYVVKPASPNFDLMAATRAMLLQCPVRLIPRHVLGYEDDDPDAAP